MKITEEDRDLLIARGMLASCDRMRGEFSLSEVEVVARYADCSVFICPICRGQHDDRHSWSSNPNGRMGYTVVRPHQRNSQWGAL